MIGVDEAIGSMIPAPVDAVSMPFPSAYGEPKLFTLLLQLYEIWLLDDFSENIDSTWQSMIVR